MHKIATYKSPARAELLRKLLTETVPGYTFTVLSKAPEHSSVIVEKPTYPTPQYIAFLDGFRACFDAAV